MSDRRREQPQAPEPPKPADDAGYTDEEAAEVQKRLEELGYVE